MKTLTSNPRILFVTAAIAIAIVIATTIYEQTQQAATAAKYANNATSQEFKYIMEGLDTARGNRLFTRFTISETGTDIAVEVDENLWNNLSIQDRERLEGRVDKIIREISWRRAPRSV